MMIYSLDAPNYLDLDLYFSVRTLAKIFFHCGNAMC